MELGDRGDGGMCETHATHERRPGLCFWEV